MSAAPSEDKIKRVTRFDPPGINYKGKMIGLEDVTDPRGDKMCQVAMAKLKAAVVVMGEHKQRINVNISLEGIKIIDEKENVLHSHPVHRISFISRDTNDSRAFGYVYNREDGVHQFCGIKTEKAAEPLVTCLRDLFQTVVELKKEKDKENVKNENALNIAAIEIKDKVEEKVEIEKSPVSTDLLGLEGSVTGVQQGIGQMNVFSATSSPSSDSSSSAWLNNNLFQNVPTQNVANLQSGALHIPQAAAISGNPYLPQGMAAPLYQKPAYPQPFPPYSPQFPSQHPTGVGVVGAVGMHTAWPQSAPPAAGNVQGLGSIEVHPSNPNWMSFDTSMQLSGMFGDLSSPIQPTSVQPASAVHSPSNDPFASAARFPDPFADLAFLPSQTASQPGKKASKEDFIKEPPKPTLLDLSTQQQQRQQPASDLTTATAAAGDPFATVSPPKTGSPLGTNPFQQEDLHFRAIPFAPNPAHGTVDKSRTVHPPAPSGFSAAQNTHFSGGILSPTKPDFEDLASGQVSRPRPRSNAGTKAAFVLPLSTKVKPSMLCTIPSKHLHDEKLQRINNTTECKTNSKNRPYKPSLPPLTCLQMCDSAENAAQYFDELWLLSAAHRDGTNNSEESIWGWASANYESGKTRTFEKGVEDTTLKDNASESSSKKQNSTFKAHSQNLDKGEIRVQNFENYSTSSKNVTGLLGPSVSLTKIEKHLNLSDRDLGVLAPSRRHLGLPISEHGNVTKADRLQSCLLPANSTSGKLTLASLARRSSTRKTCSLKGLVTIREENDSNSFHPSLQPAVSANGNDNINLLQAPSFLTKHTSKCSIAAKNSTQNAAQEASSENSLKLNPFAVVDPFVTDAFALGDPFDNQNGRLFFKDGCCVFDLLQVDSTPFCTRAVTVDLNTKRVC